VSLCVGCCLLVAGGSPPVRRLPVLFAASGMDLELLSLLRSS
jgi:hypothetical protein